MTRYLDTEEAAAHLNRSSRWLLGRVAERSVPFRQPVKRGRLLFDPTELDAMLEGVELERVELPGGGLCVRPRAAR